MASTFKKGQKKITSFSLSETSIKYLDPEDMDMLGKIED